MEIFSRLDGSSLLNSAEYQSNTIAMPLLSMDKDDENKYKIIKYHQIVVIELTPPGVL